MSESKKLVGLISGKEAGTAAGLAAMLRRLTGKEPTAEEWAMLRTFEARQQARLNGEPPSVDTTEAAPAPPRPTDGVELIAGPDALHQVAERIKASVAGNSPRTGGIFGSIAIIDGTAFPDTAPEPAQAPRKPLAPTKWGKPGKVTGGFGIVGGVVGPPPKKPT